MHDCRAGRVGEQLLHRDAHAQPARPWRSLRPAMTSRRPGWGARTLHTARFPRRPFRRSLPWFVAAAAHGRMPDMIGDEPMCNTKPPDLPCFKPPSERRAGATMGGNRMRPKAGKPEKPEGNHHIIGVLGPPGAWDPA
jgi:hypothetical protein